MTVLRLEAFSKEERLTAQIQSKVTPSEYAELVRVKDELHSMGLTEVTVSSLVRTFVLSGLKAFRDEDDAAGE